MTALRRQARARLYRGRHRRPSAYVRVITAVTMLVVAR